MSSRPFPTASINNLWQRFSISLQYLQSGQGIKDSRASISILSPSPVSWADITEIQSHRSQTNASIRDSAFMNLFGVKCFDGVRWIESGKFDGAAGLFLQNSSHHLLVRCAHHNTVTFANCCARRNYNNVTLPINWQYDGLSFRQRYLLSRPVPPLWSMFQYAKFMCNLSRIMAKIP
jgi:hypothetical protein